LAATEVSPLRIWWVDLGELDNQRVLAQHQEIHMLRSLIVGRGNPWGGFHESDGAFIKNVHDRSVIEMRNRGWFGHKTPMDDIPIHHDMTATIERLNTTKPIRKRVATDRWHLWLRWQGEYRGRIPFDDLPDTAKDDYAGWETLYHAQGGCLHDGPVEEISGSRRLCLLCKHYSRDLDSKGPWEFVEKGKRYRETHTKLLGSVELPSGTLKAFGSGGSRTV
jgi:Pyrimidine dimer DNA glycosylase